MKRVIREKASHPQFSQGADDPRIRVTHGVDGQDSCRPSACSSYHSNLHKPYCDHSYK